LSGVNGSVASRGVSAAYTIHVRVYIFATARAAAANIGERVASQQPATRRDFETFVFRNGGLGRTQQQQQHNNNNNMLLLLL